MNERLPHKQIQHVVVLMLENRGFDHLMGWLYAKDELPRIIPAPETVDKDRFLGLSSLSAEQRAQLLNPSPRGGSYGPMAGARSPKTPSYNPGESYGHIMNQMWGINGPAKDWLHSDKARRPTVNGQATPLMNGYVYDYAREIETHTGTKAPEEVVTEIMDTYVPEQLPVLSGLARFYAVSDEWFCSVPSQTNTNRAFSMAGTSNGMVNNSFYEPFNGLGMLHVVKLLGGSNCDALPEARTLFEVLDAHRYTWKLYWQDAWPPEDLARRTTQYVRTMFPQLAKESFDDNFERFNAADPSNALFRAARAGALPAVSWIEPAWGGGKSWDFKLRQVGNDMHPVSDTTVAEEFVLNLYNALSANPEAWARTLLVITFDENGGTYDHLPPPKAVAPGLADCPETGEPYRGRGLDPDTRTQFGFDFQRFGVRVPTLLVSPCLGPNTVFRTTREDRTPFDHTSIIASILTLAEIPREAWQLGHRVLQAPTFVHLLGNEVRRKALLKPHRALTVPMVRARHRRLWPEQPYLLEYIGSRWPAPPERPRYVSNEVWSSGEGGPSVWTLTEDRAQAHPFRFSLQGITDARALMNMTVLRIASAALRGDVSIGVARALQQAFLLNNTETPGVYWQLRLLGSRDPLEPVYEDDDVVFFSCLPPAWVQTASKRFMPDAFERLKAMPGDSAFLTTGAGEWGMWRAVRRE